MPVLRISDYSALLSGLLIASSQFAPARIAAQAPPTTPVLPDPTSAPAAEPAAAPTEAAAPNQPVPPPSAAAPATLPAGAATSGEPRSAPTIVLPPAAADAAATSPAPATSSPAIELPRESAIENPLGRTPAVSGTAIGGYGELTLNAPSNGPGVVDLRRFVLFFGHNFTDKIRMYSEVEVEHAVASSDDRGEVEIEQAYLDGLLRPGFNLRGGLILMPAGIINVYHEPPSFNGVDRPDVDQLIIPSTWREAGLGVFGELITGLRYQFYVVTGFDANGFTAESAIREGHTEAQLARASNFGAIMRLDYEPLLGTVIGATAYASKAGDALPRAVGSVPLALFEIDARTHSGGFSARGEAALLMIGDTAALSSTLAQGAMPQMEQGAISSLNYGGYLEAAYDLLYPLRLRSEHSVSAFGRFDYSDTQAHVPRGFTAQKEFRRYSGVFGLVWRPIQQIAIKADFRRREFGTGPGYNEWAAAFTWLF